MRRLLAAILLALTLGMLGAGAASAAPRIDNPTECHQDPTIGDPTSGFTGFLEGVLPSKSQGSEQLDLSRLYETYGTTMDDTVLYSPPGCAIASGGWLSKLSSLVPVVGGLGVASAQLDGVASAYQKVTQGPDTVASFTNQATGVGAQLTIMLTRFVFVTLPGVIVAVLTPLGAAAAAVFPELAGVTLAAALLWAVWASRKGKVRDIATKSGFAVVVVFLTGAAIAQPALAGTATVKVLTTAAQAGTGLTPDAAGDMGDVVGNALAHGRYQTWCYEHLGNNAKAVTEYCPKLYSARNVSKSERAYHLTLTGPTRGAACG